MVGSSKKAISGSSSFSSACKREITSMAFSESPPRSKKFLAASTSSICKTSAHTFATAACTAEILSGDFPFAGVARDVLIACCSRTPLLTLHSLHHKSSLSELTRDNRSRPVFPRRQCLIVDLSCHRPRQTAYRFNPNRTFRQSKCFAQHRCDRGYSFSGSLNGDHQ